MSKATTAVTALWLVLCASGVYALWSYASTPGQIGAVPRRWPATAATRPDPTRPTLLLFVHPRCPCTRATMDDLAWVLTRARGRVAARAYFFRPADESEAWTRTALWKAARALGVSVAADPDGAQARLFGAATSGMTLIYAPDGRLLYDGGLTPGRGHEGDGPGREAALAAIAGTLTAAAEAPVFGCALIWTGTKEGAL